MPPPPLHLAVLSAPTLGSPCGLPVPPGATTPPVEAKGLKDPIFSVLAATPKLARSVNLEGNFRVLYYASETEAETTYHLTFMPPKDVHIKYVKRFCYMHLVTILLLLLLSSFSLPLPILLHRHPFFLSLRAPTSHYISLSLVRYTNNPSVTECDIVAPKPLHVPSTASASSSSSSSSMTNNDDDDKEDLPPTPFIVESSVLTRSMTPQEERRRWAPVLAHQGKVSVIYELRSEWKKVGIIYELEKIDCYAPLTDVSCFCILLMYFILFSFGRPFLLSHFPPLSARF